MNEELLAKTKKVKAEKPPAPKGPAQEVRVGSDGYSTFVAKGSEKPKAQSVDPLRNAKTGSDGYAVLTPEKPEPKKAPGKPGAYSDPSGIKSGPQKPAYSTSLRDEAEEPETEKDADGYTVYKPKPGEK